MKYDVDFSCGHNEVVQLFGKVRERERRIAYWECYGLCSKCYREQREIEKAIGCDEVEMSYREYKNKFSSCKTKDGSYNGITKTIVVYIPKKQEEEVV